MAIPSAPTTLAIRQRYTLTDDAFVQRMILRPLQERRNVFTFGNLPEWEERWIELSWIEVEAGDCEYLLKLGSQVVQRIPKGVGRARILIGRRELKSVTVNKAEYNALPDWGANYTGTFAVSAVNGDGESTAVTLAVNESLSVVGSEILPITAFGAISGGAEITWTPAAPGAFGTFVTIGNASLGANYRSSVPLIQAFVRAPETVLRLTHRLRTIIDDDLIVNPGFLQASREVQFANDIVYGVRLQPLVFEQNHVAQGKFRYAIVQWKTPLASSRTLTWSGAPTALKLEPQTVNVVEGVQFNFEIPINVAGATWALEGTPPDWVSLDDETGILSGVAPDKTQRTIRVTATKEAQSKTTQVVIKPKPPPNPPVVRMSATVLANGFSFRQGEPIIISPSAAGARFWRGELPDGLRIDERTGRIFGSILEVGRYDLAIQARSDESEWSAPFWLPVKITAIPANVDLASVRFAWLQEQWKLTDLQVSLTDRTVSTSRLVPRTSTSTNAEGVQITTTRRALVLKARDTIQFAVLCLLGNRSVNVSGLSKIRIGIRPANNVDEPFFFESVASPTPVEIDGAFYYLVEGKLSEDAGEAILDSLAKNNVPVPAIGDVELTVDGDEFTSQTFQVELDLDVTRTD